MEPTSQAGRASIATLNWAQALPGYRIEGIISDTRRGRVYAGWRSSDQLPISVKFYSSDSSSNGWPRVLRELEVLRRLAGRGIPAVIELIAVEDARGLVVERATGVDLSEWRAQHPPRLEDRLEIGIQLAALLVRVHASHLIHGNLNPENVVVDPATREVHLIDFGAVRPFGGASKHTEVSSGSLGIDENLSFIAPEQSGRMGRGVDQRSDLYALGALLYFVFTGSPPFRHEQPLAMIHAHMTQLPEPPERVCAEIPKSLGTLILKLLEKEPEERYQAAELLHTDLVACRDALVRGELDDSFVPSACADRLRLEFGSRIFGREPEVQQLLAAFERVRAGRAELVLLLGPAGAGKSSLIAELRRRVATRVGYFVGGKFDAYRQGVPYGAIQTAVALLAFQMLAEPDDRLHAIRRSLLERLGPLAGVLVDFVPDFAAILGTVDSIAPVGPRETRARLGLVIARLFAGCATAGFPVVLALDDLQWADTGSRALLRELASGRSETPLLMLAGVRSEPVDAAFGSEPRDSARVVSAEFGALPGCQLQLAIEPLDEGATLELLASALKLDPEHLQELAPLIQRKTVGNPLLVRQFIEHLYRERVLRVADGRFLWDLREIEKMDIPDGAIGLVLSKLQTLQPRQHELLAVASCIGNEFDLDLLERAADQGAEALLDLLHPLADAGLISVGETGLRFQHDRIRDAVLALLDDGERAALHRKVALALLERTPEEELDLNVLAIADQLNRAQCSSDERDRRRLVDLNHRAGRRSMRAGVPVSALAYFRAALAAYRSEDRERDPEFAFSLYVGAAEAAFLCDEFCQALELLRPLENRQLEPLKDAQVTGMALSIRCAAGEPVDTLIDELLGALARYGVRWPRCPSRWRLRWDLFRTDWLLRGPLDERTFRPWSPGDLSWAAPLWLNLYGTNILRAHSARLLLLASIHALRMYLRHGAIRTPGLALAAYAANRAVVLRTLSGMHRYARAARYWIERAESSAEGTRAEIVLHTAVLAWLNPRRELLPRMRELVTLAREAGDLEQARECAFIRVSFAAGIAEPLEEVVAGFRELEGEHGIGMIAGIWADAFGALAQPLAVEDLASQLDSIAARVRAVMRCEDQPWVHMLHWGACLQLFGRDPELPAFVAELELRVAREETVGPAISNFLVLRSISDCIEAASGRPGRSRRRRVRRSLRQLRTWARDCPDAVNLAALVEAEYARAFLGERVALARYEKAAACLKQSGFLQYAGLANERAWVMQSKSGRARAPEFLAAALSCYEAWGAAGKVELLRRVSLD